MFKLVLALVLVLLCQFACAADHAVLVWNLTPGTATVALGNYPAVSLDSGNVFNFVANQSSYAVVVATPDGNSTKNITVKANSTLVVYNATAEIQLLTNSVPKLQLSTAHARFFHDAAAVPAVDVYFNDQRVASNLAFSQVSDYFGVTYGLVELTVRLASDNNTIVNTTFRAGDGQVVIVSLDDAAASSVVAIENFPPLAAVQLGVFTNSSELDVLYDGRTDVFTEIPGFAVVDNKQWVAVVADPSIVHNFTVTSNGTQLSTASLSFQPDGKYRLVLADKAIISVSEGALVTPATPDLARVTVVNVLPTTLDFVLNDTVHERAYPTLASHNAQVYVEPAAKPYGPFELFFNGTYQNQTFTFDPNSGTVFVVYTALDGSTAFVAYPDYAGPVVQEVYFRLIHAVPDAPAVDLLVNDSRVISNVRYGGVSRYVNTTMLGNDEDVDVTVVLHGTNDSVAALTLMFNLYTNYTFAAVGSLNGGVNDTVPKGVQLVSVNDDNTWVAHAPKIRVLNLVPDSNRTQNVTIGTESPSAFTAVQSLSSSDYVETTSGKKKTVTVQLENYEKVLTAQTALEAGSVYTVVIEGWVAARNVSVFVVRDLRGGDYEPGLTTLELFLLIGGGILFGIMLLTIIVFAVRSRGPEGYEQLPN